MASERMPHRQLCKPSTVVSENGFGIVFQTTYAVTVTPVHCLNRFMVISFRKHVDFYDRVLFPAVIARGEATQQSVSPKMGLCEGKRIAALVWTGAQ